MKSKSRNYFTKTVIFIVCLFAISMVIVHPITAQAAKYISADNAVKSGDYVYFKDSDGHLCRAKSDGSSYKQLTTDSLYSKFHIYGNSIFYLAEQIGTVKTQIKSILLDGKNEKVLSQGDSIYGIIDGKVYFANFESGEDVNDSGIMTWVMNIDGSGKKRDGTIMSSRESMITEAGFFKVSYSNFAHSF